jgi:pimeloyl-ACP methyl ester carboxylesterase
MVVGSIQSLTHRFIRSNGTDLHVVDAGDRRGAPIILLHGFPDFWWGWRHVIGPLVDAGRRVIVPDMRGYGRSDAPQNVESYHLDILVGDVIGLADALDVQRFDLAGHDWGGIVAWSVAARRPDRVAKLVAVAAPHPDTVGRAIRLDPRQLGRSLYVGLFKLPRVPELILSARRFALLRHSLVSSSQPGTFSTSVLARYIQAWGGRGRLRAMLNYYRALRTCHAPIGRIGVPTVVIWGGRDRFLGQILGRLALGQCNDARLTVLGEVTHWVPQEDPNAIVVALLSPGGERRSPPTAGSQFVDVHPGTRSAVEQEYNGERS